MMRVVLVSGLALAVAACGSAGDRADGEIQMKAGKWSQTMVIESFEVPGAPAEVTDMLKQMVGQEQSSESCMTQDQVDKGWGEQAKQAMAGQDCSTESFDAVGGKLSGEVVCKSAAGSAATMSIEGEYDAESMSMTMSADINDPSLSGETGKMVMKVTGKRVGDCDA